MNSLKTSAMNSQRCENIRQEVPSTSVVESLETNGKDRDVAKVSARGGARRKVLPPITPSTSIKSKSQADPLESVLPMPNTRPPMTSIDNQYKGNLPTLCLNAPITSQTNNMMLSHILPPYPKSRDCSPNSSVEIQSWDLVGDTTSSRPRIPSIPSPTMESSSIRQSPLCSDPTALIDEPPASPLPSHCQLLQDSSTGNHAASLFGNRLKVKSPFRGRHAKSDGSNSPRSASVERSSSNGSAKSMHGQAISKRGSRISFKQFRSEVQKWKKSTDNGAKSTKKFQEFYKMTFDSFASINDTFLKRSDGHKSASHQNRAASAHQLPEHQVDQKFVGMMYEVLMDLSPETQKIVLKGIINCLLNEWQGTKSCNEMRAYFILLQCPLFVTSSTYVIYAHLLRQIATLHEKEQNLLTQWLRRLSTPRFRPIVERIHQFITLRLFPDRGSKQQDLPPMSKCPWWIPSAMKVLTLLYNANNLIKPRLISHREFYNVSLDHIDVMAEFKQWQSQASHPGFTFCQYPYVLSLSAKRQILKKDQERQMIRTARDELVTSVRRRPTRPPDVNQLFLNIKVKRQSLLQDSLSQIYSNRHHLKKKLRVEFIGEPGYDMGGLTKEWFLLLLRQVLSPDYGTFVHNEKTRTYWFATSETESFSDYFLVGVLMGLAVYNCITLDLRFPLVLYRKLLSTPVSGLLKQSSSNSQSNPVGVVPVSLDDLKDVDPDMAHGFEELLSYEGDVEEDFGICFQASKQEFGIVRHHHLKSSGDKIPVTNSNKKEYVQCYLNWILNKAVYRQFSAFSEGFHTVCDSSALSLLCAEEVETLACGNSVFDMRDLKKFTTYEGFAANDPTILHFWDVTLSMQREMQKKLLHFCTGSDRVPVGGMQDLKFKIIRAPTAQNMLPMAHTCFNQLLLPPYGNRTQLEQKLIIAVSNAEGFGLE